MVQEQGNECYTGHKTRVMESVGDEMGRWNRFPGRREAGRYEGNPRQAECDERGSLVDGRLMAIEQLMQRKEYVDVGVGVGIGR